MKGVTKNRTAEASVSIAGTAYDLPMRKGTVGVLHDEQRGTTCEQSFIFGLVSRSLIGARRRPKGWHCCWSPSRCRMIWRVPSPCMPQRRPSARSSLVRGRFAYTTSPADLPSAAIFPFWIKMSAPAMSYCEPSPSVDRTVKQFFRRTELFPFPFPVLGGGGAPSLPSPCALSGPEGRATQQMEYKRQGRRSHEVGTTCCG
jgi:hypothetical protein